MQVNPEVRLLTAAEAGDVLRLAERTVQERGSKWMEKASERCDAELPSSPKNGLRSIPVGKHRRCYDGRDMDEYQENATREAVGAPLIAWRQGGVR